MPSLGDLIDEVTATLAGYTSDIPAQATLVDSVTDTDNVLVLDFGDGVTNVRPSGLVEIDRELLMVSRWDASTGTAVVPPWGRGQRGTKPVAHAAGSRVTVRPRFPRQSVANVINEVIGGMAPDLHGVVDLDPIVINAIPDEAYPLPANTLKVLRIEAEVNTVYPHRQLITNYRVNTKASGMELELQHRLIQPYMWQTLTVTVATTPGRLVDDTDDYCTVTGLDQSTSDIPVLGAMARMVLAIEAARAQVATVEANTRSDRVAPGSVANLSKMYQALYTQRLANEVAAIQSRYPLVIRRIG